MIRALLVAIAASIASSGCSGLKVEGECSYVRELRTTYQCKPDGRMEHWRLAPTVD